MSDAAARHRAACVMDPAEPEFSRASSAVEAMAAGYRWEYMGSRLVEAQWLHDFVGEPVVPGKREIERAVPAAAGWVPTRTWA